MNKYIHPSSFVIVIVIVTVTACQPSPSGEPERGQPSAISHQPSPSGELERGQPSAISHQPSTASKGKIEAVREIPVFSRIAEQIVMFGIERTGQHVRKGQVVARLSDAALREKILHSRARLEKAEFQYQAILMGQGYKHDHLNDAPENIRQLARINSGYNEAKAELHELQHQLSYCVITAPVSGAVSQIRNTLYGAALPGEALFYIVDTEHLKVTFDVLENELAKYQMGTPLSVSTVTYPSEQHSANVSAISPVIDANGMVHIEATLAPHPHLMPGMTAFITIIK